jgi:hypothetical protein
MMADFDRFHFGRVTVIEAQLLQFHLTDEWSAGTIQRAHKLRISIDEA